MKSLLLLLLVANVQECFGVENKECDLSSVELEKEISRAAKWELVPGAHWRKIGSIKPAKGELCAFHYSAVTGTGKRGIDRLVILHGDGKYMGSYRLTLPESIDAYGNTLRIQSDGGNVDTVAFPSEALPDTIFVDGEVVPVTP